MSNTTTESHRLAQTNSVKHAAQAHDKPMTHAYSVPNNHNDLHTSQRLPKRIIQLVFFVLTILALVRYWNEPLIYVCDGKKKGSCLEHNQTNQRVSSIVHQTLRAIIVILVLIQIVYLLDINIAPIVATFGVVVAAMGFTVSVPLHDYVMGICLALSRKLELNTTVNVTLYGQTGKQGPILVTNLSPLTVDGLDQMGNTIHMRYSYIQAIEISNNGTK